MAEGVVDTAVSAGERLAYAVFDDSMSWDEKWAYAFDPGQMVADFVTGVVIGEFLDGIMAETQNKLRSIFANNDATMREALESGSGNKPYTNSRPSYGKNQVNEVWENAKDPITGKVYDPSGVEITWDKTKSRNGQWDMGHIPGEKYSEMHQLYMDDVISSYLNNEKAECDYFSFWKGDSVFERSIEKSGFVETGFETFLAIKLLDKSLSELDVLLDFANWRLVMGDSDAF